MTSPQLDTRDLLGALGQLHSQQRRELAQLENAADELAARDPERAQALETRLMAELFPAASSTPTRKPARIARLLPAAVASCAMAAAALLWVTRPPSGAEHAFDVSYTLVPPAPDAQVRSAAARSEPDVPGKYTLGRTLTFTLRPTERYTGQLRVLCYAAQGDKLIRLDPQLQIEPEGGAQVVLPTRPQLNAGSWELLFYVSPLSATALSASQLHARRCPEDTRCLAFNAQFVQPEAQ